MALNFEEDLRAFFDIPGFTVPVVSGDVTDVGYYDSPTETIADGLVLTPLTGLEIGLQMNPCTPLMVHYKGHSWHT